jgi:hypothetical protein
LFRWFSFTVLVLTKVKAMMRHPLKKEMLVKQMQGKLWSYVNNICIKIPLFFYVSDHVDLCTLIVTHKLEKEYAKNNNLDYVVQSAYERVYFDYHDKLNAPKIKNKQKCICQWKGLTFHCFCDIVLLNNSYGVDKKLSFETK